MMEHTLSKTNRRKSHRVFIVWAVVVVVAIGLAIWVWDGALEDRLIPKRWGVVEEGMIYRSGRLHAALVEKTLSKHNIDVVIDLTGDEPGDRDQDAEKRAVAKLEIERISFPLAGDGTGDINNYAQAIATIVRAREKGKPVLVHCGAGAQRTGGVIACYRMLIEKKPPALAYTELGRYDWDPDDDQILLTYVNDNMARLAKLLAKMGVIDKVPDSLPILQPE